MVELIGIGTILFLSGLSLKLYLKLNRIIGRKHDGQIVVANLEDGTKRFTLELDGDPDDLDKKEYVSFKIVPTETLLE